MTTTPTPTQHRLTGLLKSTLVAAMNAECPACARRFTPEDLDLRAGRGTCPGCGSSYPVGAIANASARARDANARAALSSPIEGVDLSMPPRGAAFTDDGLTQSVRAVTRSLGLFMFMTAFNAIWCGVTGTFIALVGAALYFHATGHNLFPNSSSPPMALGPALGMAVFITPFALVGCLTLFLWLTAAAGHIRISVTGGEARSFFGVGPLGFTRRFSVLDVRAVEYTERDIGGEDDPDRRLKHSITIVLDRAKAKKNIDLGNMLTPDRARFAAAVLRALLTPDGV